jgi:hypothetical protein
MGRATELGSSRGAYDAFLYAAIDEDQHGVALTVLSTLANRNLDPWEEAARLGRLPSALAVRELAVLVAGIAPGPIPRADAETIAARLQALLPRKSAAAAPDGHAPETGIRRQAAPDAGARPRRFEDPSGQPFAAEAKPRTNLSYFLFYVLFVALLIGSQWLNSSGESKAGAERPAIDAPSPPVVAPAQQTPGGI